MINNNHQATVWKPQEQMGGGGNPDRGSYKLQDDNFEAAGARHSRWL